MNHVILSDTVRTQLFDFICKSANEVSHTCWHSCKHRRGFSSREGHQDFQQLSLTAEWSSPCLAQRWKQETTKTTFTRTQKRQVDTLVQQKSGNNLLVHLRLQERTEHGATNVFGSLSFDTSTIQRELRQNVELLDLKVLMGCFNRFFLKAFAAAFEFTTQTVCVFGGISSWVPASSASCFQGHACHKGRRLHHRLWCHLAYGRFTRYNGFLSSNSACRSKQPKSRKPRSGNTRGPENVLPRHEVKYLSALSLVIFASFASYLTRISPSKLVRIAKFMEWFLSLECTQPLQEPQGLRYRGNLLPTHIALHPAILFLSRKPFGSRTFSQQIKILESWSRAWKAFLQKTVVPLYIISPDTRFYPFSLDHLSRHSPQNKKPSGCWKCAARSIGIRCGGQTVEDDSTSANSWIPWWTYQVPG